MDIIGVLLHTNTGPVDSRQLLIAIAVSVGAPYASRAQIVDTALTKASVLRADSLLNARAQRTGAAVALTRLTSNAPVLFPGQPILRGSAGARAAFLARYAGPASYSWRPVAAIAGADGKFACTFGFSRFLPRGAAADSVRDGIYITCWSRDMRGHWQIAGIQRNDSPGGAFAAERRRIPLLAHSATALSGETSAREAQDTDSTFAMLAERAEGPGPAFARNAADDAVLIGVDEFPRGPQNILAAFKDFPPERILRWRPSREFGAGSGGLAFTVGNSVTTYRDGRTDHDRRGHFLTVWRKEPDGSWKYVYDLGSPRP